MQNLPHDYTDSWKNRIVFEKQLELNKRELLNYPAHWSIFVKMMQYVLQKNDHAKLLDIGCGCGTYYKLCKDTFGESVKYNGIDYSIESIEIAKKEWSEDSFECKNLFEIDKDYLSKYDTVSLNALLDVLKNGDSALEFLLKFAIPNVIIGRAELVAGDSSADTYMAYGEITTYKFRHNIDNFVRIIQQNNYRIVYSVNGNFLLEYNND